MLQNEPHKIMDEEIIKKILSGYNEHQIQMYKERLLPVLEKTMKEFGAMKGEYAIIGYWLFEKHKQAGLDLVNLSTKMDDVIQRTDKLIKEINDANKSKKNRKARKDK
jgi:hypothetical protein